MSPKNRNLSLLRTIGSTAIRATGEAIHKKIQDAGLLSKNSSGDPLDNLRSAAAERLVRGMDELKGAAMKVGQMLSLEQDLLPANWQSALSILQSKSTPKDFGEMRSILEERWGSLDAFAHIDPVAIHAASMAQVHVGVLRDSGKKVAIKIRYPGLREHIDKDLDSLRRILKLAGIVNRDADVQRVLKKVREVFDHELDFTRELQRTLEFAKHLEGETQIVTANPIPSLCHEDLLVTSWLDGVGIDEWMKTTSPDAAKRSHIGTLLVRCTLLEIFRYRHLQSDPNPANFLVLGDGSLGLVDFGASVDLDMELILAYRRLAVAAHQDDSTGVIAAANEIGFLKPSDSQAAQDSFVTLMRDTSKPFSTEFYDWGDSKISDGIKEEALRFARLTSLRVPPETLIFLNRRVLGTQLTLEKLAPKVRARALFKEIVQG
jgi:aarF domain-containing kinase